MKIINFINSTIEQLSEDIIHIIKILINNQKKNGGYNKNRPYYNKMQVLIDTLHTSEIDLSFSFIVVPKAKLKVIKVVKEIVDEDEIINTFLSKILNEDEIINTFLSKILNEDDIINEFLF